MNGVLLNNLKSAAQVFQEEGLLFYPSVFEGDELERLREACVHVRDQFFAEADVDAPHNRNAISMRHLIDPRWHQGDKKHWNVLMEVIADPRCLGPTEQIFRGESLFRCTSLFFNPRFESNEGDWHRDLQFVVENEEQVQANIGQPAFGGVQLQIALVDNDDIEYVPFSPGRYDSPEEYRIRCADERSHNREGGMPNAMRIRQRAGDAIIFNSAGLHRGRYYVGNPRLTLMLTYTPRQYPFYDYFSTQPWMLDPEFLDGLSPRALVYFEDFINVYRQFWLREQNGAATES